MCKIFLLSRTVSFSAETDRKLFKFWYCKLPQACFELFLEPRQPSGACIVIRLCPVVHNAVRDVYLATVILDTYSLALIAFGEYLTHKLPLEVVVTFRTWPHHVSPTFYYYTWKAYLHLTLEHPSASWVLMEHLGHGMAVAFTYAAVAAFCFWRSVSVGVFWNSS